MVEPDVPFVCPLTYNQWNTIIQWNYLWPTHHDTKSSHTSVRLNVCRSGRRGINRATVRAASVALEQQPRLPTPHVAERRPHMWVPPLGPGSILGHRETGSGDVGTCKAIPTAETPRTLVLRQTHSDAAHKPKPQGHSRAHTPAPLQPAPLSVRCTPQPRSRGRQKHPPAATCQKLGKTNEKFRASGNASDRAGKGAKC